MDNGGYYYFSGVKDGEYTLKITARHAKGRIYIGFDKDRTDKTIYNSSIGDIND